MKQELKVSFYLKRERRVKSLRSNPDQVFSILGKITLGKDVAQFSSKLKIEEHLWDVVSGRAIGKSKKATSLNRELDKISVSIHTHYKEISHRMGKVSVEELKNAFQGIALSQMTLIALFKEMQAEFKARIGIDRSASTFPKYRNSLRHIRIFLREKYNLEDIPLNQLDRNFIEKFDFYLRVEKKFTNETIVSIVALLLKVVRIAFHRNYINQPPFYGYKLVQAEFKHRTLTKDEFHRLKETHLESSSLSFIRDLFLFGSYTGISYADLKNLSWQHITIEPDRSLWISMSRQKTGIAFNVKLLSVAVAIINKYKGIAKDGKVFPILKQGRINFALKIIAKKCKIEQKICYHQSRHTFASLVCLSQGVPIESVSRMMGHRNIQTTQRYARVNNEKIGKDMQQLSSRLSDKFKFLNINQ